MKLIVGQTKSHCEIGFESSYDSDWDILDADEPAEVSVVEDQ